MSNVLSSGSKSDSPGPTRQQLDELDALLQRMLDLPVNQAEEPPASASPEPEDDLSPPPGYPPASDYAGASPGLAAPPGWGASLAPRVVTPPGDPALGVEPPVPGGRHDLEDNAPVDPTEELARIRAQMQQQAGLPPSAHIPNPPAAGQGDWVPRQTWQPSAQTWKPLAERWEQNREGEQPRANVAAPPTYSPPRFTPSGPRVTLQTSADGEAIIPPPPMHFEPAAAPAAPTPPPTPAPDPWPLRALAGFNAGFDLVLLAWCPRGKLLRGPVGRSLLGTVGVVCLLAAVLLAAADWCGWPW